MLTWGEGGQPMSSGWCASVRGPRQLLHRGLYGEEMAGPPLLGEGLFWSGVVGFFLRLDESSGWEVLSNWKQNSASKHHV